MRLKLEKRANPSRLMMVVTPIASVLVISGGGESTAWLEDEPDRLLAALGL